MAGFMSTSSDDLRQRLRYMCKRIPVPEQPQYLELLRPTYSHTITLVEQPPSANIDLRDYTCFAFALGLVSSTSWPTFAAELFAINTNFVETLVNEGILVRVPETEASDNDIVLYLDPRPKHAGLKRGDRVLSKWGRGWLCEHGLFEVAAQLGDVVEYYRPVPIEAVESALKRHLLTPEKNYVLDENDEADESAPVVAGY